MPPGRTLLLVSASTGATVHTLRGHRDRVSEVRFSPDGTLVGSVSEGGELIVWDTATGRPLERWHTFDPYGVGFSPDNDLVYGGGGYSMLRTWDLSVEDTYLQRTTQVGDAEVFAHADFSPDGRQVAYSWLDGGHGMGQVRRHRHRRSDATRARAGVTQGPWASRHLASRTVRSTSPPACTIECAGPASSSSTPPRAGSSRNGSSSTATSGRSAYVDGNRSLLVGDSDGRIHIVDAETLQPRGEPFDITAHNVDPDRGREHRDGPRDLRATSPRRTGG